MDYDVVGSKIFDDHYNYSLEDVNRIGQAARQAGASALVTTDKDFVRLPQNSRLPLKMIVLGVALDFGEQELIWNEYIRSKLEDLIGN